MTGLDAVAGIVYAVSSTGLLIVVALWLDKIGSESS